MYITLISLKQLFVAFIFIFQVECQNFKIVGGTAASILDFPFQVAYYSAEDFVCSGSLISPQFILTAAHCTHFFPMEITIRLGSTYRHQNGIMANVEKFYKHPYYNPVNFDYDIALLLLGSPVRSSIVVQLAKLPSLGDVLEIGQECTVSGWGLKAIDDMDEAPLHLLAAKVKIVDFQQCKANYQSVSQTLTNRMICAAVPDGKQDACLGDSGGPLVCNGTLWGVISFGYGCGMKDFPGIYSKIQMVIPWIKRIAQIS